MNHISLAVLQALHSLYHSYLMYSLHIFFFFFCTGDEDEDTESGAQRLDCARSSHHSSFKSKQGANADDWEDVKNQILLSHKECPQDPKQTSSVREIYKELNAINQKLKVVIHGQTLHPAICVLLLNSIVLHSCTQC